MNKPFVDYGIRKISTKEVVSAFGAALAAFRATGGSEKLALFYLNNQDRCSKAPKVHRVKGWLTDDLKPMADQEELHERAKIAAQAYNEARTLAAIRKACKCGGTKATELLDYATGCGWITKVAAVG